MYLVILYYFLKKLCNTALFKNAIKINLNKQTQFLQLNYLNRQ